MATFAVGWNYAANGSMQYETEMQTPSRRAQGNSGKMAIAGR
jgi:hypothetical protein